MEDIRLLADVGDWKRLADKLSLCAVVSKHDTAHEREGSTLAHAFADLEESFFEFHGRLARLLKEDLSPDLTYEVLLEIGEDFRHILYHIKDPKFYRYLIEPEESDPLPTC
jgi:hypothetical protein